MAEQVPSRDDSSIDVVQQFAEALGPFDPPADYVFEPELRNPTPRQIPDEIYAGPYYRTRRNTYVCVIFIAAFFLLCGRFPIVGVWGLYFLPLAYIDWIALGMAAIASCQWFYLRLVKGPLKYIEEGIPIVGRIAAPPLLKVTQLHNGVPTVYGYSVFVEYRDPTTKEQKQLSTTHTISAHQVSRKRLTYTLGEYVTLVYLRSNPEKSLRLYGLLGLRSDLGIVNAEREETSLIKKLGFITAFFALFFGLAWDGYAFGKYGPLELTLRQHLPVFIFGAIALGGIFFGVISWDFKKSRSRLEERNREAAKTGGAVQIPYRKKYGLFGLGLLPSVLFFLGAVLLCGGTVLCWAFSLNAMCDSTAAHLRPVKILNMVSVTHGGVFREYKIEYAFADDPIGEKNEMMSTPWHMLSLIGRGEGNAHVRGGYFGWPWVETITPKQPNALGGR